MYIYVHIVFKAQLNKKQYIYLHMQNLKGGKKALPGISASSDPNENMPRILPRGLRKACCQWATF